MIKNFKTEGYPKFTLVKQKRWRNWLISIIEPILRVEVFKKTKMWLLYIYIRYLSIIPLWYLKKKRGNTEPVMYGYMMHNFAKNNWKELRKGDSK